MCVSIRSGCVQNESMSFRQLSVCVCVCVRACACVCACVCVHVLYSQPLCVAATSLCRYYDDSTRLSVSLQSDLLRGVELLSFPGTGTGEGRGIEKEVPCSPVSTWLAHTACCNERRSLLHLYPRRCTNIYHLVVVLCSHCTQSVCPVSTVYNGCTEVLHAVHILSVQHLWDCHMTPT